MVGLGCVKISWHWATPGELGVPKGTVNQLMTTGDLGTKVDWLIFLFHWPRYFVTSNALPTSSRAGHPANSACSKPTRTSVTMTTTIRHANRNGKHWQNFCVSIVLFSLNKTIFLRPRKCVSACVRLV